MTDTKTPAPPAPAGPERDDLAAALAAERELNRRIIESMPGGIVHVTAEGAVVRANAEAQRILGLAFDDLTQRYIADFQPETFHEDMSPCPVEDYPVARCLATGKPQPAQTVGVRRPDGHLSWAVFRAMPLRDPDGALAGAVVTFLDVSERKAAEAERLAHEQQRRHEQKLQAIGTLAAGIAHDFNNLLQGMLGHTQLALQDVDAPGPTRDALDRLIALELRARDLVKRILAFARRHEQRRLDTIDVGQVIAETGEFLRASLPSQIAIDITAEAGLYVAADAGELLQVLLNLGTNAGQAMPAGGGLALDARRGSDDGATVVIRVRDDGEGMDAETLERATEPFFTTRSPGSGTGMGLAIVHGIVEDLGGRLTIESRAGAGTTVAIELPAVEAPAEATIDNPHPVPVRARVLFVDDEPDIVAFAARLLERYGVSVEGHAVPAEARDAFDADPDAFDVVITDMTMPDLQGDALAAHVLARRPQTPVVVVTGFDDPDLVDRANAAGVRRVVRKPLLIADLLQLIAEATE